MKPKLHSDQEVRDYHYQYSMKEKAADDGENITI
jgi:hypothetical protein